MQIISTTVPEIMKTGTYKTLHHYPIFVPKYKVVILSSLFTNSSNIKTLSAAFLSKLLRHGAMPQHKGAWI